MWGPGLLVMLADTDAGQVVTAAQAGARWGYRLLPLILLLIPVLYLVQELTVRLGIGTGRGYAQLVRERFGGSWAGLAIAGLALGTIASLVAEFAGIAGIGALYGIPRAISLVLAAAMLLSIVATGSYRRVERTALLIALFEVAFFAVAALSHPKLATVGHDVVSLPFGNRAFAYLGAAIVGASFNPWMIFYQQSALAERKLGPADYGAACWDTATGAVLTQLLTAAVLIAAAATLGTTHGYRDLKSIGEIGEAFAPLLGAGIGRAVFSLGVLGASFVAAIVSSLALAWAVGEVAGYQHALEERPFAARWFCLSYAGCVLGAAVVVWAAPDLVALNIAAQVLNAFLLPLVIGLLLALAATALPESLRPSGWRFALVAGLAAALSIAAICGGIAA